MTPQQKLEDAKVRVRAKAFAARLRSNNWAEFIPVEDGDFLCDSDERIKLYKDTLKSKGCVQRQDLRWEFRR
jgi:hypothetical protein